MLRRKAGELARGASRLSGMSGLMAMQGPISDRARLHSLCTRAGCWQLGQAGAAAAGDARWGLQRFSWHPMHYVHSSVHAMGRPAHPRRRQRSRPPPPSPPRAPTLASSNPRRFPEGMRISNEMLDADEARRALGFGAEDPTEVLVPRSPRHKRVTERDERQWQRREEDRVTGRAWRQWSGATTGEEAIESQRVSRMGRGSPHALVGALSSSSESDSDSDSSSDDESDGEWDDMGAVKSGRGERGRRGRSFGERGLGRARGVGRRDGDGGMARDSEEGEEEEVALEGAPAPAALVQRAQRLTRSEARGPTAGHLSYRSPDAAGAVAWEAMRRAGSAARLLRWSRGAVGDLTPALASATVAELARLGLRVGPLGVVLPPSPDSMGGLDDAESLLRGVLGAARALVAGMGAGEVAACALGVAKMGGGSMPGEGGAGAALASLKGALLDRAEALLEGRPAVEGFAGWAEMQSMWPGAAEDLARRERRTSLPHYPSPAAALARLRGGSSEATHPLDLTRPVEHAGRDWDCVTLAQVASALCTLVGEHERAWLRGAVAAEVVARAEELGEDPRALCSLLVCGRRLGWVDLPAVMAPLARAAGKAVAVCDSRQLCIVAGHLASLVKHGGGQAAGMALRISRRVRADPSLRARPHHVAEVASALAGGRGLLRPLEASHGATEAALLVECAAGALLREPALADNAPGASGLPRASPLSRLGPFHLSLVLDVAATYATTHSRAGSAEGAAEVQRMAGAAAAEFLSEGVGRAAGPLTAARGVAAVGTLAGRGWMPPWGSLGLGEGAGAELEALAAQAMERAVGRRGLSRVVGVCHALAWGGRGLGCLGGADAVAEAALGMARGAEGRGAAVARAGLRDVARLLTEMGGEEAARKLMTAEAELGERTVGDRQSASSAV